MFNPGDNHGCVQKDSGTFDYRGINISKNTMLDAAEEITGKRELPIFTESVIYDEELICYLRPLHEMILLKISDFGKEENLFFLISELIQKYGQVFENSKPEFPLEIERACEFIRCHYNEKISLDQICQHAGLSKSTLLRNFTKAKGIFPYRYLETVRINHAKQLLKRGVLAVDVALQTGFSDQSHFTKFFISLIGISPGSYRNIFLIKEERGR